MGRSASNSDADIVSFIDKMLIGFKKFEGQVLIILSGDDLTAAEFRDLVKSDKAWSAAIKRNSVEIKELIDENHTFSSRLWREKIELWTLNWLLDGK